MKISYNHISIFCAILFLSVFLNLNRAYSLMSCASSEETLDLSLLKYFITYILIFSILKYFIKNNKIFNSIIIVSLFSFLYLLFSDEISNLFLFNVFILSLYTIFLYIFTQIILNLFKFIGGISKKVIVIFLFLLLAVFVVDYIVNSSYISNNGFINTDSFNCSLFGGREREDVCGENNCELLSIDYGKDCKNDSECEKFCEIENSEKIKSIFNQNYSDLKNEQIFIEDVESCTYKAVGINDWEKKTGIKIKGKCSMYFHPSAHRLCSSIYTNGVSIQNDILMVH